MGFNGYVLELASWLLMEHELTTAYWLRSVPE
jgi:hypothetical protein